MAEAPTPPSAGDDFEAGKVIFDKLKDLPRERQERILRWVAELLGITNPVASVPPKPPAPERITPPPPPPANSSASANIRTFVEAKQPKTDIQFVTAVAHFYRFEAPEAERRSTIDAEFAQQATRLADWDRLTDPLSTLNNAVTRAFLTCT